MTARFSAIEGSVAPELLGGAKILTKSSTLWAGRTNVTDRQTDGQTDRQTNRQTDGRTAYAVRRTLSSNVRLKMCKFRDRYACSAYFFCRLKSNYCIDFLGRKIHLSGISPVKRSRSGPNSVYVDRSRGDNVQGILGAIGLFWPKWRLGRVPRSPSFFVW